MNDYFHQKYGRIMVAKYRTKGQDKFGRKFYDNKNETCFNGCPLKDKQCSEKRGKGLTPTFWEFVQAIIHDGMFDGHWLPIHLFCRYSCNKISTA